MQKKYHYVQAAIKRGGPNSCAILELIYHELYGEGNYREGTCSNLVSNSVCKFPNPHLARVETMAQTFSFREEVCA